MSSADTAPLTATGLIHELSAEWVLPGEPLVVSGWDPAGNYVEFVVTGISVRARDGKVIQSLKLHAINEGARRDA